MPGIDELVCSECHTPLYRCAYCGSLQCGCPGVGGARYRHWTERGQAIIGMTGPPDVYGMTRPQLGPRPGEKDERRHSA